MEMLESLLAFGGLVLLRGEDHRDRAFRVGHKGRKWRGKTVGHSQGWRARLVLECWKPQCSPVAYRPSLSPDSVEWEGRSLLKALIKKSALR